MVLSQTKVHGAKSSVSIRDRCWRKSKNRENIYYTFPWYSPRNQFCRLRSFIRMYLGSASLPFVQFKVLSPTPLRFFWPLHLYLLSAGVASLHGLFLLFIYSSVFYHVASFILYLFSVPLGKPFIFCSQSFPKIRPFSWQFFPIWRRTISQKLLFWNTFFF